MQHLGPAQLAITRSGPAVGRACSHAGFPHPLKGPGPAAFPPCGPREALGPSRVPPEQRPLRAVGARSPSMSGFVCGLERPARAPLQRSGRPRGFRRPAAWPGRDRRKAAGGQAQGGWPGSRAVEAGSPRHPRPSSPGPTRRGPRPSHSGLRWELQEQEGGTGVRACGKGRPRSHRSARLRASAECPPPHLQPSSAADAATAAKAPSSRLPARRPRPL